MVEEFDRRRYKLFKDCLTETQQKVADKNGIGIRSLRYDRELIINVIYYLSKLT